MDNKKLALIGTTLLTTLISGQSNAGKGNFFTDYAKVLHVEPIYRYVTVQKPERRCEIIRPTRSHRNDYSNGRNNRQNDGLHNSSQQGHSLRTGNSAQHSNRNTGSATFIGAVIGGAIGHHVTRNINGHGNTGGTLVGAAIGSSIAQSAARNQSRNQANPQRNHSTLTSNRQNQHASNRQNQHGHDGNNHQSEGVKRCHTTTVSHEERRQNGYNVTYRYHGHTFKTKTSTDPGQRIAVSVQIKPH